MQIQELLAQAMSLPSEDRRFIAEAVWDTVDKDLPNAWADEATIATEVERRYEEFRAKGKKGLSHEEVFAAARAVLK